VKQWGLDRANFKVHMQTGSNFEREIVMAAFELDTIYS
jgi:hypothetical protein